MADLDQAVLAFKVLGERLKTEGADDLRRELSNAITDATRPVLAEIREGLPRYMPNRYAATLDEDLRLSVTRAVSSSPGVRITASPRSVERRRLRRLEGGVLAHPLFGNRRHWYNQTSHVRAGFFTEPISQQQPQIRDAIIGAMGRVAQKLTRKV